jgi:hypothetical protein
MLKELNADLQSAKADEAAKKAVYEQEKLGEDDGVVLSFFPASPSFQRRRSLDLAKQPLVRTSNSWNGNWCTDGRAYSAKDNEVIERPAIPAAAFAIAPDGVDPDTIRARQGPQGARQDREGRAPGTPGRLRWTQDASGLTVILPDRRHCDYAIALKITGDDLRGFKLEAGGR